MLTCLWHRVFLGSVVSVTRTRFFAGLRMCWAERMNEKQTTPERKRRPTADLLLDRIRGCDSLQWITRHRRSVPLLQRSTNHGSGNNFDSRCESHPALRHRRHSARSEQSPQRPPFPPGFRPAQPSKDLRLVGMCENLVCCNSGFAVTLAWQPYGWAWIAIGSTLAPS